MGAVRNPCSRVGLANYLTGEFDADCCGIIEEPRRPLTDCRQSPNDTLENDSTSGKRLLLRIPARVPTVVAQLHKSRGRCAAVGDPVAEHLGEFGHRFGMVR